MASRLKKLSKATCCHVSLLILSAILFMSSLGHQRMERVFPKFFTNLRKWMVCVRTVGEPNLCGDHSCSCGLFLFYYQFLYLPMKGQSRVPRHHQVTWIRGRYPNYTFPAPAISRRTILDDYQEIATSFTSRSLQLIEGMQKRWCDYSFPVWLFLGLTYDDFSRWKHKSEKKISVVFKFLFRTISPVRLFNISWLNLILHTILSHASNILRVWTRKCRRNMINAFISFEEAQNSQVALG